MRVLHINVNYTLTALHQTMIEHLNLFGIENTVFVPTYNLSRSSIDCNENVILSECFKKWDRLSFFRKQKKIINSIDNLIDVSQFDIIHAYTLFTDGNVAMNLSQRYGVPYVVAVRNTDVNVFLKRMIHLRKNGITIMQNASAVFFLSPAYRDTVLNNYVPREIVDEILEKTYIIPNGIDDYWHSNPFERNTITTVERIQNDKEINCIYAGCINKNKNTELTLKALSKMNRDGWKCTLTAVGKIADKNVFKSLCTYPFFNYVEPKSKEELINYYRSADVFVMPSHTETFGLVYAEALSQGLPVIYTKGQGFDGQFPEGEVGYHVDDNNILDVSNTIQLICERYEDISLNCIAASKKFDWNRICEEYRNTYQKVLSIKNR